MLRRAFVLPILAAPPVRAIQAWLFPHFDDDSAGLTVSAGVGSIMREVWLQGEKWKESKAN
ncbi:MAG: hypothetical protein ACYS71_00875 [Planctomycetota bacterium]